MKAIVCTRYGMPKVFRLNKVVKPAAKDDELPIRVNTASVNALDWSMMRAQPFVIRMMPGGFLQPRNKTLGADVAGRLETIGRTIKQLDQAKRQVKSPKVYLIDSGLLHALLNLPRQVDIEGHPKAGASWEGFVIGAIVTRLGAGPDECFFWAAHSGAALDLLVARGGTRRGFEIKRTSSPRVTPSMRSALEDLKLDSLDVVHAGEGTFDLAPRIRAVALSRLLVDVPPL
jgi:Domain of unknown function (DUF4143)